MKAHFAPTSLLKHFRSYKTVGLVLIALFGATMLSVTAYMQSPQQATQTNSTPVPGIQEKEIIPVMTPQSSGAEREAPEAPSSKVPAGPDLKHVGDYPLTYQYPSITPIIKSVVPTLNIPNAPLAGLTGTKNIPGDYATLALAITDLNTNGVGSGGVIFNVTAVQTAPAGGYVIGGAGSLVLTSSSAANPITFTGNGNTITAFNPQTVAAINDGIIKLVGADFVTIQGFSLQENPLNTISATAATNNMTEFGVALFYVTAADGAQNNTIQNNTISLNRTYLNTFAIYSNTRTTSTAVTGSAEATAATGSNSNNKIYGNSISNVNYGIVFIGAGTTIAAIDSGNDIGGVSAATGNTITNWGGGATLSNYTSLTGSNYCIFDNQQINDNVSFNTITSAALAQSVTTGGFLKNYSVANPVGTITTTINNNTVTVTNNPSAAGTGAIIGISNQGLSSLLATATMSMNNNTVQNCVLGGATSTTNGITAITNLSLPGTLNMTGNNVLNNSITATTATTGIIAGITNSGAAGTVNVNTNVLRSMASTAASGQMQGIVNSGAVVTALNINNNQLGNSTSGFFTSSVASSGVMFGIVTSGGAATCALSIQNNDIRGITYNVAASANQALIQNTAATLSQNISGNTFTNLNINTTGQAIFISDSVSLTSTGTKNINNNQIVTAFNKVGAGSTVLFYNDGGPLSPNGAIVNNNNNNFSNVTVSGATTIQGWSNADGASSSNAPTKTITGNTFNNINGGTGTITVLQTGFSGPTTATGNTISNVTGTGSIIGLLIGSTNGQGTHNYSSNTITNLTSNSPGGGVNGIQGGATTIATLNVGNNSITGLSQTGGANQINPIIITAGTSVNIFKNKIANIQSDNAGASINGIAVTAGTTFNISNNLVGDLRLPSTNAASSLTGILLNAPTTANVYYNTVYLNATSSGAVFGSAAVFSSTTTTTTLRNNIFVNTSTPNTTGLTVAYLRGGTSLANYGATSSNNDFFAGIPGTSRLIFNDGTNSDQTLAAYKTRVGPTRDAASVSDLPPLNTTSSSPQFLHVTATTGSGIINGGAAIAGFPDDYDGDTRDASTPDMGADEVTSLQFSSGTYSVAENVGGGTVTITVTRTAGTGNAATVQYATSDGSATGGATCTGTTDYVNASNTLNFAAGDTSRTFNVTICPDTTFEPNETVTLTLSNATGSILGSPNPATLTITNDDPNDVTFNASGNLAAGTYDNITINGPAVVTMTGDVVVNGCVNVNSGGALLMGGFTFTGAGCFTLSSSATLGIGSAAGITTGATGNVQVGGARSFSTGGYYVYNGTGDQAVGNALPGTVANLTIANTGTPGTVTGNSGQVVTGLLEVADGVYSSASDYNNVQIDGGATLSLTADITVSGNWTNTNTGTFTPNGFRVTFDGTGNQVINRPAGETFATVSINKASGALQMLSAVNINGATGNVLELLNGSLESIGGGLVFLNNGGNILASGGVRTITSATPVDIFIFGSKTVTSAAGGTLVFDTNIRLRVDAAAVNFGPSLTTINGQLTLRGIGSVNTNGPTYGASSTLRYTDMSSRDRAAEWTSTTASTFPSPGYPNNVTIDTGSTTLFVGGPGATTTNWAINGTLTCGSGGALSLAGTFPMTVPVTVKGNVAIDAGGTLLLSSAPGGDLNLGASWSNAGTFTANGRGVTFNGNGNTQTISGNNTFFDLTINHTGAGSVTAAGSTLAVNGLLRVQSGTFMSASDYTNVQIDAAGTLALSGPITASGNWTNAGMLTPNGFGVTLDGATGQTITGTTSFFNLTKSVPAAQTLNFTAGSNTTVTNSLTLNGAAGQLLALRSTVSGSQWNLSAPATQAISYVDAKDSNASGGTTVTPANSVNSGNNVNWAFTQAAIVYVDPTFTGPNGSDPPGPGTSIGYDAFATIQGGINGVATGGQVIVAAATYVENPSVTRAMTINGAQFGVDARTRVASESVVRTNGNQLAVFTVTGTANVTIDGFTIDGDDPGLAGPALLASGDDTNVQYGVRALGSGGNLNVSNSIIKKVFIGVRGDVASQGNLVNQNLFDSIGNFDFGYAVSIRNNFYADVTNNKMTRSWTGIHINNHNGGGGPAGFNITGNEIHSYAGGILYWLQYNGATGATINNNQMTAEAGAVANNFGVLTVSIQNAVNPTFTNNTMTGHNYGIGLFNVPTTSTITLGATNAISGATLAGVFLTDNLNFNPVGTTNFLDGGPGAASTVNVTGMPVTGTGGSGLKVEGGTNAQSIVATSATVTGFPTGITLQSANAGMTAHFNRIIATTTAINNPNNVTANLENNWWGCNAGPGNAGCGAVTGAGADFDPWIVLLGSATPNSIAPGGNSTVAADMTHNSATAVPAGTLPDIPDSYSATHGTMNPTTGTIVAGAASSLFTSTDSSSAVATITADNQNTNVNITVVVPTFSIDDVTHNEGNGGLGSNSYTFTITKSGVGAASVDYNTVDGSATAPSDYTAIPATPVSFLSADTSKQFTVFVNGDTTFEGNEAFTAHLSNAVGATISDADGTGTITNDDACAVFATVYVDDDWVGTAPGTDPDGVGPATSFGCDSFATIQGGVNGVSSGGTVNVAAGTYTENVTIAQPLTLTGAGAASVMLRPATSNPNCGGAGGGSLCAGGSNLILVQASNVTISGLTLDGDNPGLTSGEVFGGADIDARNGIITNHLMGVYNSLEVHHTTVKNIYLRGMYASSGGTFNFHDDTVQNVQANPASIGMFNFAGAGAYTNNNVSACNDAISSNHSRGTTYTGNTVTTSASGIHSDNAGDSGGTNDTISGNTVTNSQTFGYGIWVFVAYKTVHVQNNTVTNTDVGYAVFGDSGSTTSTKPNEPGDGHTPGRPAPVSVNVPESGSAIQRPNTPNTPPAPPYAASFTGNTVDGQNKANSTGVYFTTSQIGFGSGNPKVEFKSNTVVNNVDGFYLEAETGFTLETAASFNRIVNNTNSQVTQASGAGLTGTLNGSMENNWWGCNAGPNNVGCGPVVGSGVDFNPWLVLGTSASPNPIAPGGMTTVTADMTHNSDSLVPSVVDFVPPVGVSFTATQGTILPATGTITNGQATSTFTSISSSSGTGCATVDNSGAICTNIIVTPPSFTINDVTHLEGSPSGTTSYVFTVTKSGATAFATSVNFSTVNGTATLADNDYQANSGTLNFGPTDTTMPVTVLVNKDTNVETDEAFTVHLDIPVNATIADADGTGTITNDDFCTPLATVYVDDDWAAVTPGTDPDGVGPATNFGCDSFATIQGGVNGVTSGGTVIVRPGTYAEAVLINKPLTLNGAQVGANANTRFAAFTGGPANPKADPSVESIITAAATAPTSGANDTLHVMANNVTIDGFVVDGNNAALNQTGASVIGGINTDSRRAIQTENAAGNPFAASNTTVRYNVIQNFAQRGVELVNGTASNTAPATTSNLITQNRIRNFGLDGIVLAFNAYADITLNTIDTNDYPTEAGIWVQDFLNQGSPYPINITNNNVTVGQDNFGGIWINLAYLPTLNINNNTVNAAAGVTNGSDFTYGIYITSLRPGSNASLNGNIVGSSGGTFDRGIALWNLGTGQTTTVTGGTVGHSFMGVSLHDNDPNFGLAGSNSAVNLSGVSISGTGVSGSPLGVFVDALGSTGDTVAMEISGNTSIANTGTAINVNGANASANIHNNAASIHDNTVGIGVFSGSATITSNNLYANSTSLRFATGASVTAHINRFISTTTAIDNPDGLTPNLENNWWGCNAGPGNTGCGAVTAPGADFDPWIVLLGSATPNSIAPGGTSTVAADMTHNSAGAVPVGTLPNIPDSFSATHGTMNPTSDTVVAGADSSLFTSTDSTSAVATITVDNQNVNVPITVNAPAFTIDDVTHLEGSPSGTTSYVFTVTKSGATAFATSVNFSTVNGTATLADNDYQANSGTLNFGPTDTTMTATVLVNKDTTVEPDEAFTVHLDIPVNATIADADGTGTITNDDFCSPQAIVYVDDDWAAVTPGTDPDGVGPATNFGCDSFATIQEGIDGVTSGGTVIVYAGTYNQATSISLNKSLTLRGPNFTISPNGGVRVAEALITGTPSTVLRISLPGSPVTIEGFKFDSAGVVDAYDPALDITIRKNIYSNGISGGAFYFLNGPTQLTLDDNHLTNAVLPDNDTIFVAGNWNGTTGTVATITNNVIENTPTDNASGMNLSNVSGTVSGNQFTKLRYYGILLANNSSSITISGNVFDGIVNPDPTNVPTWGAGIRFYTPAYTGPVNIKSNTFKNSYVGVGVRASGGNLAGMDIHVNFNRIIGNTFGIRHDGTGPLEAQNNWWGCNAGPGNAGCDSVSEAGAGNTDFNPWIVLGVSAVPDTIGSGGTSTVTADMTRNSDGATPVGGTVPQMPVAWSATNGTMTPPSGTITAGQAMSTFTSANNSSGSACAMVDNQQLCTPITVSGVSFAINDVTHNEGDASTTSYVFTVTKSGTTALSSSVNFTTQDGSATLADNDYVMNSDTLTFGPSDTTMQITVLVNGDTNFESNEAFNVHLSGEVNATISDADGTGTITNDDQPTISGHLTYQDTASGAPNVTMTLTGNNGFVTRTTITDANGDYTFNSVPVGNDYTVTPSRAADLTHDPSITAFDASRAARYAALLMTLTTNQQTAGDVTNNGEVTAFDASQIARFEVNIPTPNSITGSWKFTPGSLSINNLGANQTGQNLTAILVGDISGDWAPHRPNATSAPLVTIPVSLPNKQDPPGGPSTIPISVGDTTGQMIGSYSFDISFNPAVLQLQPTPFDATGTITPTDGSWGFAANTATAGHLILSAFGTSDLTGQGVLLKLKFNVIGGAGATSPLTFVNFKFNEGTPDDSDTNGFFTVAGPSAAAASVSGQIVDGAGQPVSGVTVTVLGGTHTIRAITDSNGYYKVENLEAGGFYTVTPTRANYVFAPASRSFSLVGNKTDAVFTGLPINPETNPLESPEFFVRQQYLDFLGREPEQSGLDYWSGQLRSCGQDPDCTNTRRLDISAAFYIAQEFQDSGLYIYDVYEGALGRRPDHAEYAVDRKNVVGGPRLETDKATFASSFVDRAEFQAQYPLTMNAEVFVDALLRTAQQSSGLDLGNSRTALITLYNSGSTATESRSLVLRSVVEGHGFKQTQYNAAFVLMEYYGYLGRNPDGPGYDFWLHVLNDGDRNNYRGMVCSFITSAEYQQRFSPIVTRGNVECATSAQAVGRKHKAKTKNSRG
jgi:hypothetical protein